MLPATTGGGPPHGSSQRCCNRPDGPRRPDIRMWSRLDRPRDCRAAARRRGGGIRRDRRSRGEGHCRRHARAEVRSRVQRRHRGRLRQRVGSRRARHAAGAVRLARGRGVGEGGESRAARGRGRCHAREAGARAGREAPCGRTGDAADARRRAQRRRRSAGIARGGSRARGARADAPVEGGHPRTDGRGHRLPHRQSRRLHREHGQPAADVHHRRQPSSRERSATSTRPSTRPAVR